MLFASGTHDCFSSIVVKKVTEVSSKLIIFELDNDEAQSILKVFPTRNLTKFLPEIVGEETAHESMDAMEQIVSEVSLLEPPEMVDDISEFFPVSVKLTNSQIAALLKFVNRLTKEDVQSWGYSKTISSEVVNAAWCIKEGLTRGLRNIDQPEQW